MGMTIDCLPDEILVKIFVLHRPRRIDDGRRAPKPEWRDACRWAPLMGVCRHWRTLALQTPLLWQVVDVGKSTRWLELALIRSRDAVLELYFHVYPTSVNTLSMLIPHMHRVRKLLLPPMPFADLALLSSVQPATFPVLDELQVWVNDPEKARPADYVPFDLSPPRAPALSALRLAGAVVPWTIATMSRLRYINLRASSPSGPKPSFAQFLDVLEECHELEVLWLRDFISGRFAFPSPHDPTRTIRLPKLRELLLREAPESIAHFVANVYLQEMATVRLAGDPAIVGHELQQGFDSLLPRDTSNLPILRKLTDARVGLSCRDAQYVAGMTSRWGPPFPFSLALYSDLDYNWGPYHSRMLTQFRHIFTDVPLQRLTVLLDPGDIQPSSVWIDLLAAFPTLRRLDVNPGGDPLPVFDALSSLSVPRTGPPLPLCPNLTGLEMNYLAFSEQQHRLILAALRKRADLGLVKLDYLGLRYEEDEARRKMQEVMERDGATAGDISDYVTDFDCSSFI
ncbi:hypothetical protein K466DRAFT_262983 [Polyporus arcularius HHB13444]|uniref:F-box domain-containing protein n=1 Tax=Polyporus arcularius HHB13444 TaxID=1314778 RepID=A0A5C3P3K4_9APHY|nr:hypothetical protein K466DRAFT_262983 [Polyporus arcularius HHB13444]